MRLMLAIHTIAADTELPKLGRSARMGLGLTVAYAVLNGLWAPNQGWFPEYAGGEYELDGITMIVSRGLEKGRAPRVFNRPELVVVKLEGI